jgi:hypothetical protein
VFAREVGTRGRAAHGNPGPGSGNAVPKTAFAGEPLALFAQATKRFAPLPVPDAAAAHTLKRIPPVLLLRRVI